MALARLIVPRRRLVRTTLVLAVVVVVLAGADALAQRRFGGRFPIPTEQSFDGGFNFCRAAFRTGRYGRGGGWGVDYPDADVNFSIRLSELTRTRVSFDAEKTPRHFVLQLTDDALFRCPFIMMTEVGSPVHGGRGGGSAARVPAQGRLPLGRRLLGRFAGRCGPASNRRFARCCRPPSSPSAPSGPIIRCSRCSSRCRAWRTRIPSINFWAGSGGGIPLIVAQGVVTILAAIAWALVVHDITRRHTQLTGETSLR